MGQLSKGGERPQPNEFRITSRSQSIVSRPFLRGTLTWIVAFLLVALYFNKIPFYLAIEFFSAGYVLFEVLPCAVIHLQYLVYNRFATVVIEAEGFSYSDESGKQTILLSDVKRVRMRLAPSAIRGTKWVMTVWERYNYAIVDLASGSSLVLTCLLINDLRGFFESLGWNYVVEETSFPIVRFRTQRDDLGWEIQS